MVISRTADDLDRPIEVLGGKGAYRCGREVFVVLCLGERAPAGEGTGRMPVGE